MSQADPLPATSPYLIWSHEHGAWWRPGSLGYTSNINEAGRYTRGEAIAICRKAIPGTAQRLGALPELPVRLIDVMDMGVLAWPVSPDVGRGEAS